MLGGQVLVQPIQNKGSPSDPSNYLTLALTCSFLFNFLFAFLGLAFFLIAPFRLLLISRFFSSFPVNSRVP